MRRAAAIAVAVAALATHAAAQDTRSELLEKERTEKSAALHPNEASRVERVLYEIEDRDLILRLFNPPRGLFVRWGGLPEGAGFGAGPAVRYSNHDYSATLTSVFTTRGYWELDGRLAFPNLADRNMFAEVGVRGHDFPQEDFYGFGPDSQAAKLSYGLFEQSAHALVGVWPGHEWFTATAEVEYLAPEVDRGTDPLFPPIHVALPPAVVHGLVEQPDFVRTGATVNINNLDAPFGTSLGGYYTVSVTIATSIETWTGIRSTASAPTFASTSRSSTTPASWRCGCASTIWRQRPGRKCRSTCSRRSEAATRSAACRPIACATGAWCCSRLSTVFRRTHSYRPRSFTTPAPWLPGRPISTWAT